MRKRGYTNAKPGNALVLAQNNGQLTGVIASWQFSTSTTASDPGDGYVRFNNAAPASVTAIYIDNIDGQDNPLAAWLDTMTAGAQIAFRSANSLTQFVIYTVVSVTDSTGYRTVAVTWLAGVPAFLADEPLAVEITKASTPGAPGDPGANGLDGKFSGAEVIETGASRTLGAADVGKTFIANRATAVTFNLDPAATLGATWMVMVKNIGVGTLTIDPNGSETVDGSPTLVLATGQSAVLSSNGSEIRSFFKGSGDVSGPSSAADNAVALFDGTTGKLIKNSGITIVDEDDMSSNSATKLPTQQSVKAYVDANAGDPPITVDDYRFRCVEEAFSILSTGVDDEGIREIGNVLHDPADVSAPYKFVYSGYIEPNAGNNVYVFWASSLDGRSWTKQGKLITSRSAEDPFLVKVGSTYFLYVEDKQAVPFRNIRLYTSTDFSSWTDQGDVIVYNSAAWENSDVSSPTVHYESGTFYLFYEGRGTGQQGAIGLATSTDGIAFTKHVGNPIVTGAETARGALYWATSVVPDDIRKVGGQYIMTAHPNLSRVEDAAVYGVAGIMVSDDLIEWREAVGHPVSLPPPNTRNTLMFHELDGEVFVLSEDRSVGVSAYTRRKAALPTWTVAKSASQTISTSGWQTINLDLPNMVTEAGWDPSTYTFTAPRSGMYRFSAAIRLNPGANPGRVSLRFYINGTFALSSTAAYLSASSTFSTFGAREFFMRAGETMQLQVERSAEITTSLAVTSPYLTIEQLW